MAEPTHLLITGAAGFLGAATVKMALLQGHRVTALVRNPDATRLRGVCGNVAIEIADLNDSPSIASMLNRTRPDVIIHSAWEGVGGQKREGDVQFENIRTSTALADAAIAAGITKFVGIGSQAEYGRLDRRIIESDLPNPTMAYGAAKLAAYHLIRQKCWSANVDFAWLRLFAVYGPGDNANWLIPSALAAMKSGTGPQLTPGTQRWDYLHIDDAASALVAAAGAKAATGLFNLSSGVSIPVRTIIETLRDHAAPEMPLEFGSIAFGPNQIMHLEGDNSRLKAATGWTPKIDILKGLQMLATPMQQAA